MQNRTWRRMEVGWDKRPALAGDSLHLGVLARAAFAMGAFLTYALFGLLP
ncbi:MAG: hypothetical protein PVJ26_21180 [Anaerolineae bacterium]